MITGLRERLDTKLGTKNTHFQLYTKPRHPQDTAVGDTRLYWFWYLLSYLCFLAQNIILCFKKKGENKKKKNTSKTVQGDGEIWKISSCISFLWYQVKPRANPLKSVPGMTEAMQSIFQFNWILQQPMNKHSWEPNSPFNTYFHWLSWERRGSFFPCAPPPLPHFIFIFLYEIVFLFSKVKKRTRSY